MLTDIPDTIKNALHGESFQRDSIGLSGGSVLLFPDRVLKVQAQSEEAENEALAMRWLEGRLPAPKLLAHERQNGKSYLLMSRLKGRMACDERYMKDPERLTGLLAQALRALWQVDASACPLDWSLDRKLAAAEKRVIQRRVDVDNVEADTFGPGGFKDPEDLLHWLKEHRPAEEPVLSHGDFCLPNVFFAEDGTASFLDLGRTGVADRWQDIALCYRSLLHNYDGKYTGKPYPGFDPSFLFEKLELEPDWEKIRYYILLDELF